MPPALAAGAPSHPGVPALGVQGSRVSTRIPEAVDRHDQRDTGLRIRGARDRPRVDTSRAAWRIPRPRRHAATTAPAERALEHPASGVGPAPAWRRRRWAPPGGSWRASAEPTGDPRRRVARLPRTSSPVGGGRWRDVDDAQARPSFPLGAMVSFLYTG